jgi:syntaxin 1B/2/3
MSQKYEQYGGNPYGQAGSGQQSNPYGGGYGSSNPYGGGVRRSQCALGYFTDATHSMTSS